ncbi:MAG TPA: hypothetical protein EYP55_10675 [Anaerolineae bacterium]|nr:hypothetical protein [Anaerolineae bacterium]
MNSLTQFNWQTRLQVVLQMALARLRMISRYPGWFLLDIMIPTVMAAFPILLGKSMAGPSAGETFRLNTGTDNYVAYLLIGANVFMRLM